MKVIDVKDFESFSFIFKGEMGHRLAEFIMRFLAIDDINQVCENSEAYTGAEFTSRLLDDLGVNYVVGNAEQLKFLPEGSFITVSNHPYGALDGVISIDLIARIRADYRFMANQVLYLIRSLNENFILVTPTGKKKTRVTGTSIRGIRDTLEHIRNGHPVGFFPSGAVSDFSLKDLRVRDRKWQGSILHVIHSVKVPILPIRFFDINSLFFYFLGMLNWRIRSLRLPSELFNKSKQQPRIGIGNLITVEELQQFPDAESLGTFLRKRVYEMPLPSSFVPRKMINPGEN